MKLLTLKFLVLLVVLFIPNSVNSIVICNDVLDVDLWLVDTTKTDAFLQTLSNEDFEEYIDHFSIFSGEKDFKQLDIFNKINIQKNNDSN